MWHSLLQIDLLPHPHETRCCSNFSNRGLPAPDTRRPQEEAHLWNPGFKVESISFAVKLTSWKMHLRWRAPDLNKLFLLFCDTSSRKISRWKFSKMEASVRGRCRSPFDLFCFVSRSDVLVVTMRKSPGLLEPCMNKRNDSQKIQSGNSSKPFSSSFLYVV